jgi:hypothetical protein
LSVTVGEAWAQSGAGEDSTVVRPPRPPLPAAASADSLERDLEPPPVESRDDGLDRLRQESRSSRAAVMMSLPVPGWGQLYAEAPFWGVVAFGAQMYFLGNILMELRRVERERVRRDQAEPGSAEREFREQLIQEHREKARDFVWWSAGALLIIGFDAYVSVQLVDFDDGGPPTPDLDQPWDEGPGVGDGVSVGLNFRF